jgi:hypothetical protein
VGDSVIASFLVSLLSPVLEIALLTECLLVRGKITCPLAVLFLSIAQCLVALGWQLVMFGNGEGLIGRYLFSNASQQFFQRIRLMLVTPGIVNGLDETVLIDSARLAKKAV